MKKIVGIEFKQTGKIYHFDPNFLSLTKGDKVIVETIRGIEMGNVVTDIQEVEDDSLEHELKQVIRKASDRDKKNYEYNLIRAEEDIIVVKEIVKEEKLAMKVLSCEYVLDGKKLLIYYNADKRIDFRELVKKLALEFKVRIELRQIGPREGAKMLGGLGYCGRELCCKNHIREFEYVTMKMAKDQGMALTPDKVSGVCGKLMCCIGYEDVFYKEQKERLPQKGDVVDSPNKKKCRVQTINYISEKIKLEKDGLTEVWTYDEMINKKEIKPIETPNKIEEKENKFKKFRKFNKKPRKQDGDKKKKGESKSKPKIQKKESPKKTNEKKHNKKKLFDKKPKDNTKIDNQKKKVKRKRRFSKPKEKSGE